MFRFVCRVPAYSRGNLIHVARLTLRIPIIYFYREDR